MELQYQLNPWDTYSSNKEVNICHECLVTRCFWRVHSKSFRYTLNSEDIVVHTLHCPPMHTSKTFGLFSHRVPSLTWPKKYPLPPAVTQAKVHLLDPEEETKKRYFTIWNYNSLNNLKIIIKKSVGQSKRAICFHGLSINRDLVATFPHHLQVFLAKNLLLNFITINIQLRLNIFLTLTGWVLKAAILKKEKLYCKRLLVGKVSECNFGLTGPHNRTILRIPPAWNNQATAPQTNY